MNITHDDLSPAGWACSCALHRRRLFTGALLAAAAAPVLAQQRAPAPSKPPPECKRSMMAGAVPADSVESQSAQQYRQMLASAQQQRALAPDGNPQLERLRYIAARIIPFTRSCNPRSANWRWEVNLIGSKQANAFCMPGGKIAFFYGILSELQLSDDEVALIMGHEIAHALLEHAREQMGKSAATTFGLRALSALFGLGTLGDLAAQGGAQFMSLKYSRNNETEADMLGALLAADAGYNPGAGVTLWQKMSHGRQGDAPPVILSTHPTGPDRIKAIESQLPRTMPIYQAAAKPDRVFGAPQRLGAGGTVPR